MSENFKENEEIEETADNAEEIEEIIEEATEDAIGAVEAADAMESVVEEGMHEDMDVSGIDEAVEPEVQYAVTESTLEDIPVKSNKGIILGIVIALVVALLAGVAVMGLFIRKAPYNYLGYINVSGNTIKDIADMQGIELSDFLAAYNLPSDMPATTDESAAYYMIPTGVMAEMYGMDFNTFKTILEIPDTVKSVSLRHKLIDMISDKFNIETEINENTPWGITEGEMTLGAYVGDEDAIKSFKEEYGFGDEITADTQWKEVRNTIDKANLEARKEAEKMAEQDVNTDDTSADSEDEATQEIDLTPDGSGAGTASDDDVPTGEAASASISGSETAESAE